MTYTTNDIYIYTHIILTKNWGIRLAFSRRIGVPKIAVPNSMRDFRPISCCNVIYKCIAKLIVHRLKHVMPTLIGARQSAFVEGSDIVDNVLFMQEVLKNYHKDDIRPRCALKIDIQKAYDSVSWEFLFGVLDAMDFPHNMPMWIKECVSSVHYSISLNGFLEGNFKGTKGLRQGDPMSPYLFLMVMEAFSCLLQHKTQTEQFQFHPKCGELQVSHVCFADDLFILAAADVNSIITIKNTLELLWSGLYPNLPKSSISMAGATEDTKAAVCGLLNMECKVLPVRYLGVPLLSSRLSYSDCSVLKDRILKRVQNWHCFCLMLEGFN